MPPLKVFVKQDDSVNGQNFCFNEVYLNSTTVRPEGTTHRRHYMMFDAYGIYHFM